MSKAVIWFRQDLRIGDNPALYHACQGHTEILPIYIYNENLPQTWGMGGAQRWWLHHSLTSLAYDLEKYHLNLILIKGHAHTIFQKIIKEHHITDVYWNRCYEPYQIEHDINLKRLLSDKKINVHSYNGSLIYEPWKIKNKTGQYYKVFSHYWNAVKEQNQPVHTLGIPKIFPKMVNMTGDLLKNWNLLPEKPNWAENFSKYWQIGETAAHHKLEKFIETKLESYQRNRDFPGIEGTSILSPHLHFGEISPHTIWKKLHYFAAEYKLEFNPGFQTYLRELGWREFCHYLLYHVPDFHEKNFNKKFDHFEWSVDTVKLNQWKRGLTGFPLVDAGMRQLWHTGWMHNRMRMVVGSFLTKNLQINWLEGSKWFWDTLVDADLANNSGGWQWIAGSGADAQPYFRIFNPLLQSKKFDSNGDYIRKWVPELAKLSNNDIHAPWELSPQVLLNHNIELGKTYPYPIVDHTNARKQVLNKYKIMRL